jgi:hypothetical protein
MPYTIYIPRPYQSRTHIIPPLWTTTASSIAISTASPLAKAIYNDAITWGWHTEVTEQRPTRMANLREVRSAAGLVSLPHNSQIMRTEDLADTKQVQRSLPHMATRTRTSYSRSRQTSPANCPDDSANYLSRPARICKLVEEKDPVAGTHGLGRSCEGEDRSAARWVEEARIGR